MAGISIPKQRAEADTRSLTQPGARRDVVCPSCASRSVTSISMVLTDGTPVRMTSCHRCEHRSWTHEGTELPIDLVLTKATKTR